MRRVYVVTHKSIYYIYVCPLVFEVLATAFVVVMLLPLIDLITINQSRYSPRSNESIFLELLGIEIRPTLGDRAFQSAASYLWNALPSAICDIKTLDTFKTDVETHFFNLAFK